MLEQKDLQSIGNLIDEKLTKNNKVLKDEIADEITTVVNTAFNEFEGNINKRVDGLEGKIISLDEKVGELDKKVDELDKKVELRPTLEHIMNWGDKKIVSIELDMDKLKYLHLKEFKNLPPQPEISRVLAEDDLKKKDS